MMPLRRFFCNALTHIDLEKNLPKMVDISDKISTIRTAHARVRFKLIFEILTTDDNRYLK